MNANYRSLPDKVLHANAFKSQRMRKFLPSQTVHFSNTRILEDFFQNCKGSRSSPSEI